ncbi:MAG: WXG100 family type VII secretion target [Anaerolineales bacterium]|nr:WXG100 family type VII secretion target [Anaerolineales bacterium]
MAKKIHMDVDSVQGVISLLERKKEELTNFLRDTSLAVRNLEENEWAGASPDQFYGEYELLCKDVVAQVDYLGALAGRLRTAIAEFEAAAAKLS